MFRRIVFSVCLAVLVAGIALTAIQQLQVAPIIVEAETYEVAEPAVTAHAHADGGSREHEGWTPEDGLERTFWTGVATAITNAVFWVALGTGCAIAFKRLA